MAEGSQHSYSSKRTGRRLGPTNSPGLILDAARTEFGEHGFGGTTVRAIARDAAIDAALIHHFFLSKEGVFAAAVQDALEVPELMTMVTADSPGKAGERLISAFINYWDTPDIRPRIRGLLRSVKDVEGATETVRDFLGVKVLQPVTAALGNGQPELRASLAGSLLLGLAYMRYVFEGEPIASMSAERLAELMGDVCDQYLTERI